MEKKYKVNDIFYSLQGEGANTGRPAVFVRFAGCNLRCPFCDTEFDSFFNCSADYIVTEVMAHCIDHGVFACRGMMVVLTGGEPTLQADEVLIDKLHEEGFFVAMESNGTLAAPGNVDWLTVSPKNWWKARNKSWVQNSAHCNEMKIVFDEQTPARLAAHGSLFNVQRADNVPPLLFLQPCDTGNPERNASIVRLCVDYIKRNPQWRLSLQTHKLIGID
jgi:organic radical activating enzyme